MKIGRTHAIALVIGITIAGIVYTTFSWFELDSRRLRVGYVAQSIHQFQVRHAINSRAFHQAGLDLKFVAADTYSTSMDVVKRAGVDVALVDLASFILAERGGLDGWSIIAGITLNGSAIVVGNVSSIVNASTLANSTIELAGLDGTRELLLRAYCNGTLDLGKELLSSTSDDVNVVTGDVRVLPSHVASGDVDAIVSWEHVTAVAVAGSAGGKYLVDSGEVLGTHQSDIVIARNEVIDSRTNILETFLEVLRNSTKFIDDPGNRDEILQEAQESFGINKNPASTALDRVVYEFSLNSTRISFLAGIMAELGMISLDIPVSTYVSGLVNASLIERTT